MCCSFTGREVVASEAEAENNEVKAGNYVSAVYNQIDFGSNRLSYDVFEKAYHGYLNLKSEGKLKGNILTVCNFELSSVENRMWIIDMNKKKVLFNTYVAHGQGSGDEYAVSFSNKENSHKSSLGFYVTGETYRGEHGTSLRLDGMDAGYNTAARARGVVVHGSEYVNARVVDSRGKLGRSWGCPAVSSRLSLPIINTIKDGNCLFIYYPEKKYFASSYWLNKKIDGVQENVFAANLPTEKVIQYMTNERVDSVKTISIQ
jgi:hypothetical protein